MDKTMACEKQSMDAFLYEDRSKRNKKNCIMVKENKTKTSIKKGAK